MLARLHTCRTCVAIAFVAACASGVLSLVGCRTSGPPRPPGPLPAVNATVPNDVAVYFDCPADSDPNADTRVVARCRGSEEFWKKTRGNWEYTWGVVRCDVLTVERGTWPDATVSFLCWDAWPTPESGIMVSKPPWPYFKDTILVFDLDTTQHPARVLGQVIRHDPRRDPNYFRPDYSRTQPAPPPTTLPAAP